MEVKHKLLFTNYNIHNKTLFLFAWLLFMLDMKCVLTQNCDTLQVPRLVLHGQWVTSSGEMTTHQLIVVWYVAPLRVIN